MEALKFLLKLLGAGAIITSAEVQQHVYLQWKVICCFRKKASLHYSKNWEVILREVSLLFLIWWIMKYRFHKPNLSKKLCNILMEISCICRKPFSCPGYRDRQVYFQHELMMATQAKEQRGFSVSRCVYFKQGERFCQAGLISVSENNGVGAEDASSQWPKQTCN